MIFRRKSPPHFWLRLLLSLAFFCGGGLLVFWLEGIRFLEGEIVETGVLSVSTADTGVRLFIDGVFVDKTPTVILGESVGKKNLCFFQNNKIPFCLSILLGSKRAELIENIILAPHSLISRPIGTHEEIIFDPLGRGFWRLFPEINSAAAFDGSSWHLFADLSKQDALADFSGRVPFSSSDQVVFSPVAPPHRLAQKNRGILYFSGSELFFRDFQKSEIQRIASFSEAISDAFFFPNSDSILVFLPSEILFSSRFDAPFQKLTDIEDDSAHFFPDSRQIFYFRQGMWWMSRI